VRYESLNEALIDCVRAAGGSKVVGPALYPEKAPESAQRALLDALNEDRPAKLAPEQMLLVLRMARAKGHHGGVAYILEDLGYTPTSPIEPKDEAAELVRQELELAAALERIVDKRLRLQGRSNVRSVA
jgi:hypothetical protein